MSVALDLPSSMVLARPLFDADIAVAGADPTCVHNAALAAEVASLPRATAERQREFTAGRAAIHDAMRQLGLTPQAVLHGRDRAPIWPGGLTGSLSHCRTACVAAVGHRQRVRALGIDVEEDTPLETDLFDTVCTKDERAYLGGLHPQDRGRVAKLIFSAKECAYKAQYAVNRTLFDFQTLSVTFQRETRQFTAQFVHDVPKFAKGTELPGRYAVGQGLIVTAMTLRS